MTPLRVLHVIDSLGFGGAERMVVDLANATIRTGHRASVCITRSGEQLRDQLDVSIDVLVLARRRRFELRALRRLLAFARGADVVHAHMRSTMSLLLPLRMTRALRAPVVFHDHYGTIERDRSVPAWLRFGHGWIEQYVGVSPALAAWASDAGIRSDRVAMIANGIDLRRLTSAAPADLRGELGLSGNARIVLLVATLRRDKGIEVALEAIAALRDQNVHLAIAGAKPDPVYARELVALRDRLRLGDRVSFLGPRRDVASLARAADVGLLSSHTESGPLVLVEYVAAGLPVVATRTGDIGHRLAALGVPGFVPPGRADELAAALKTVLMLDAEQLRARMDVGRRHIEAFDINAQIPAWLAVYDRLRSAV